MPSSPPAAAVATPRKHRNVRRGVRDDLPPFVFKGTWEANVARVLERLRDTYPARQLSWAYEGRWAHPGGFPIPSRLHFPGERTKNASVLLDFAVSWQSAAHPQPVYPYELASGPQRGLWLEVKGLARCSGWLDRVDLKRALYDSDHDSYVKLDRLRRYYPEVAARTYLLGADRYAQLTRRFRNSTPRWEAA